MKDYQYQILISQLTAIRASCDAALNVLLEGEEEPGEQGCSHPEDKRTNLSTMGGGDHWICQACGYEYKEDEADGQTGD